jgi:hypothetical protein
MISARKLSENFMEEAHRVDEIIVLHIETLALNVEQRVLTNFLE